MYRKYSIGRYNKSQALAFLKSKVRSDDVWAFAAMKRIYGFQTPDEKASSETVHDNRVGFTQADGVLSSICRSGKSLDQLPESVKLMVRNKMVKYVGQLFDVVTRQLHTEELLAAHMDAYYAEEGFNGK